jgi:UDP-glucose:(heptosyl)LPS alpha-1,3-glucosyltransferase
MSELYPIADTLIHSTLGDTYGMVVLEAMSHKLPVIVSSSKYCGFSEHLSNEEAVILNNPKSSTEISIGIQTLTKQVELRNKISENGFKKSQAINWKNTTNKTLDAYQKI